MNLIFQLTLFALVLVSFAMVITVPVIFASPDSWNQGKNLVFSGAGLWVILVFLVGLLNSFVV